MQVVNYLSALSLLFWSILPMGICGANIIIGKNFHNFQNEITFQNIAYQLMCEVTVEGNFFFTQCV